MKKSVLWLLLCLSAQLCGQQGPAGNATSETYASDFTLKTSVDRVLVDVTVTDTHGNPVHGLTKADFSVEEDGRPQTVLSFQAYDFDRGMTYVPPKFPALPPDTFLDLPASPERGPLYVLLYDLVNIPLGEQAFARAQLVKFLKDKPDGARFAIFVSSDGLYLVQGFTADKQKLLAAVDPHSSRPHVPEIFLMGTNNGAGSSIATMSTLRAIAEYLTPLPGKKNLIWFASKFPLSFFANKEGPPEYQQQTKKTLNLFTDNQIAIDTVDTSTLTTYESYDTPGAVGAGDAKPKRSGAQAGGPGNPPSSNAPAGSNGAPANSDHGASLTYQSFFAQDSIAQATGGEAVYSSNNLVNSLNKVTEDGGNYYTLSYSPTNKDFTGQLRQIRVVLKEKGDHLSYRRAYYGLPEQAVPRPTGNPLTAIMHHGAPEDHQLIFGVHVAADGSPHRGTKQEVADLRQAETRGGARADQASARLQTYSLDYTVMKQQLQASGNPQPELEIAAAVFDADGHLLNSTINKAVKQAVEPNAPSLPKTPPSSAYRMELQMDAPLNARFLRVGVRDGRTGKEGALEIPLPLRPAG